MRRTDERQLQANMNNINEAKLRIGAIVNEYLFAPLERHEEIIRQIAADAKIDATLLRECVALDDARFPELT